MSLLSLRRRVVGFIAVLVALGVLGLPSPLPLLLGCAAYLVLVLPAIDR